MFKGLFNLTVVAMMFLTGLLPVSSQRPPERGVCAQKDGIKKFPIKLVPGVWQPIILRPSAQDGAYFVDIDPRKLASDGAYIEQFMRPELRNYLKAPKIGLN